jgi:hypothetical protein
MATATTYSHPGDKHECYAHNAFIAASQGKGIPRYTGPDCEREHVATVHELTFPAAVQALYAGDSYAAYIQQSMAESVAAGRRDGDETLGELFIGNDGD